MKLSKYDIQKLCEVEALILENLKIHYTLTDLSRRTNISKEKIKKGFKFYFGQSTKECLLKARMAYAKSLLEETNKPIKEIASVIGYSYASFIFKFRKYFGITPNASRKS